MDPLPPVQTSISTTITAASSRADRADPSSVPSPDPSTRQDIETDTASPVANAIAVLPAGMALSSHRAANEACLRGNRFRDDTVRGCRHSVGPVRRSIPAPLRRGTLSMASREKLIWLRYGVEDAVLPARHGLVRAWSGWKFRQVEGRPGRSGLLAGTCRGTCCSGPSRSGARRGLMSPLPVPEPNDPSWHPIHDNRSEFQSPA